MKIVGCDLHTRYQQIAMLDKETGELMERRLEHAGGRLFWRVRGRLCLVEGARNRSRFLQVVDSFIFKFLLIPEISRSLLRTDI
jgi:hypothetical protein